MDLRHASERDLLPKFRTFFGKTTDPVVSVTDNYVLEPLEGASAGDKPLYFIGRNFFNLPWKRRTFALSPSPDAKATTFAENTDASRLLSRGNYSIVVPSGSQAVLNRRTLPEGTPDLVILPCRRTKNIRAFVVSSLGQPATIPLNRRTV